MRVNQKPRLSIVAGAVSAVCSTPAALLLAAGFSSPALAIDHTWNVLSGDWTVGANWLPTTVPGAGDLVIIDNNGTATLDSASTIAGLSLNGGTRDGSGTLTVTGDSIWTSGAAAGVGSTTNFDGALAITGATSKTPNSGTVNANGTTTLSGNTADNNNLLGGFGTFNNAGTFKDQNGFNSFFATDFFNNSGTYQKINNTLTTVGTIGRFFNNFGTVDVQAGTLQVGSDGTHTGSFNIAAGANLNFRGFSITLDGAAFTGPGQVEMSSGVVQFTNVAPVANPLLLDGGTLDGTAVFTGPATWTSGFNTATVTFNGDLAITGPSGKSAGGTVNANATTTWSGNTASNNNTIAGFGTLNNTGTFKDQNGFNSNLGPNIFNNSGTFQKINNTLTTVSSVFNNSGAVDIQAGTLQMNSNGTHTGSFHIASGANLNIRGFSTTLDNVAFTGPGQVEMSSGVAQFANMAPVANPLLLDGGTVDGTAVFTGPATWTHGTVNGLATVTFNGDLAITGSLPKTVTGTVNANATTTWSGNTADNNNALGGFGTFNNTGTFKDQNGFNSNLGTSPFNNSGTYQKINNTLTTVSNGLNNTGTVDVQAGTMKLINSAFSNQGLINVAAGAIFWVNNASFGNAGMIQGNGTVQTGLNGALLNSGTINAGSSTGHLTLDGDLTQAATAVLNVELASLADFDLLTITDDVTLDGEIAVWNAGYVPVIGDTFVVMTFDELLGASEFDAVTTHGYGPGVMFEALYNLHDVTLTVVAVPEPEAWVMLLTGLGFVGFAMRRRTTA